MASVRTFTMEEVSNHNEKDDLYLIIHCKVYDCTKFVISHP